MLVKGATGVSHMRPSSFQVMAESKRSQKRLNQWRFIVNCTIGHELPWFKTFDSINAFGKSAYIIRLFCADFNALIGVHLHSLLMGVYRGYANKGCVIERKTSIIWILKWCFNASVVTQSKQSSIWSSTKNICIKRLYRRVSDAPFLSLTTINRIK